MDNTAVIEYQKTKITTDVAQKTDDNKKITWHLLWTKLHIIINKNQHFGKYDKDLTQFRDKLANAVDSMLDIKNIAKIIMWKKNNDAQFNWRFIKEYHTVHPEECSQNNNTIHLHIFINIAHYTQLQILADAIKDDICKALDLKNIYVRVKLVNNDHGDNTLKYWWKMW